MCDELPTLYQSFIHLSRYSRWLEEEGRRETWTETVARYFDFFEDHLKEECNFEVTKDQRKELETAVRELKIMPSMRALMTAGEALKRDNIAGYNCAYCEASRPRSFDEILYVLMCGTGMGFSVERNVVDRLPTIAEEFDASDSSIVVKIQKWVGQRHTKNSPHYLLVDKYHNGTYQKFALREQDLRPFGGRASGPQPLDDLFRFTVDTYRKAAGRKLTSVECHDIICKIAEIVVVGGVRRSALISFSSLTDERMRDAKTGSGGTTTTNGLLQTTRLHIRIYPKLVHSWKSGCLYTSQRVVREVCSVVLPVKNR
jgi:ribonucleoside-triphosphate reductase (thioredoxin)